MNRLASVTNAKGETSTLNYDGSGNIVSTTDAKGQTTNYTWNALDQLTRLQTPEGTSIFVYDPLGRRTKFVKGSSTKNYFYNGLDALSDGSSKFLHGAGIDQPLQITGPNNLKADYLGDHLGSTTQLLDSTNASAKGRLDYASYGKLEDDANNPVSANPFTYTGREDDNTGLMYYRARYYDSELEIFISQDPLGDAQRAMAGDPISLTDPLGLDAWGDVNDTVSGFGDVGSFGLSQYLREKYGNGKTYLDRKPNTCSINYAAGGVAGVAAQTYVGGVALKGAGRVIQSATAGSRLAEGAGATAIQFGRVENQINHTFRHIEAAGLSKTIVQKAIERNLAGVAGSLPKGQLYTGSVIVNGVKLQYNAYKLESGVVNVGRITLP